ncbi:MAG: hypothetical protein KC731_39720, partial [Myxococcales bacterium]|nr:hypothetical protein [Myxococcales bacterium]
GSVGGGDPCDRCGSGQICQSTGECAPRTLLSFGVTYLELDVAAHGWTSRWAEDASLSILSSEGACHRLHIDQPGPGYLPEPFDAGILTIAVDGKPPVNMPPAPTGETQSYLDLSLLGVSPTGSHSFEIAWPGGADIPPGTLSLSTPPSLAIDPLPSLVPGTPWTMTWDIASVVTLSFQSLPTIVVCLTDGPATSLTIEAATTKLLAEAFPTPLEASMNVSSVLVEKTLAEDGSVGAEGFAHRPGWLTIP